MKKLEDVSIGNRIALTIAIVVIIVILLACVGYLGGRWEVEAAVPTPETPMEPSKYDDIIDELERQALGEAFKKHIMQLFSVWVTDNYQPRIPPKATIGARNARDAYIRSMEAIEKRAQIPRSK